MRTNIVFICGAGPGDPELITVKAMKLLKNCDVVFYDRLVSKEIMLKFLAKCLQFLQFICTRRQGFRCRIYIIVIIF